jgi:beta-N-acetylhexosaminidase
MPLFNLGNTVTVRTGTIIDHNGNPVPDGTVVRFTVSLSGEGGGVFQQQESTTMAGSAAISFRIDKPGLVEVRAASEPAVISQVLQMDVAEGVAAAVTVIEPVISETAMPTPTVTVPPEENDFITPDGAPRFGGWLLSLFVLGGGAMLAYWVGGSWGKARWSTRWALCTLLGGLVVYNYLALGLPGAADMLMTGGGGALVELMLLGEIVGALCAWLWMRKR